MSPRIFKASMTIVSVAAMASFGFAPSATAATGSGSNCPTSSNGAGDVLKTNVSVNALNGDFIDSIPVLNGNVNLVCVTDSPNGSGFLKPDGSVGYVSYGTGVKSDTFTIGATDGDKYYSTIVSVNLEIVKLAKPTVTTTLKTKMVGKAHHKHTIVVRKAKVKFTNNSSSRTVHVQAGNFNSQAPDIDRLIKPGKSATVTTKRPRLDFVEYVVNDAGNDVYAESGHARTKSGTVNIGEQMVTGRVASHHMWQQNGR